MRVHLAYRFSGLEFVSIKNSWLVLESDSHPELVWRYYKFARGMERFHLDFHRGNDSGPDLVVSARREGSL